MGRSKGATFDVTIKFSFDLDDARLAPSLVDEVLDAVNDLVFPDGGAEVDYIVKEAPHADR